MYTLWRTDTCFHANSILETPCAIKIPVSILIIRITIQSFRIHICYDGAGTLWLLEFNHNPALPQLDVSAAPGSESAGDDERVGGAFARHIAAMASAALPLLLCGEGGQYLEALDAAVASSVALAQNKAGVGGRWNHVYGPCAY